MTLEEILRRTEIERKLRSNTADSYSLRRGISNYNVLSNNSLGAKEKAKRLGVSRSTIKRQSSALKSNGLTDEEVNKYREKFGL